MCRRRRNNWWWSLLWLEIWTLFGDFRSSIRLRSTDTGALMTHYHCARWWSRCWYIETWCRLMSTSSKIRWLSDFKQDWKIVCFSTFLNVAIRKNQEQNQLHGRNFFFIFFSIFFSFVTALMCNKYTKYVHNWFLSWKYKLLGNL